MLLLYGIDSNQGSMGHGNLVLVLLLLLVLLSKGDHGGTILAWPEPLLHWQGFV